MDSNPTLHDFVLNLITNQDARLDFELDPEGSLRSAGLGDLTPADVQEVVPLVLDLAPVPGITNLTPVGQDLGLGALNTDSSAVIGQLQELTRHLTVGVQNAGTVSGSTDFNVAALGAITVDPAAHLGGSTQTSGDVGIDGEISTSTSSTTTTYLTPVNELVPALNSGPLEQVVGNVPVIGGTDPALGDIDFTVNTVTSVVGDVTGGLGGTLDGLGSGDLLGGADVTVHSVTSVVGDVSGGLGGTLNGVGDVSGGLGGTLNGVGNVTGSLGLGGEAHASSGGGLLGLTDGLL